MNKEPIATDIDIRTTVEVQLAPFGDWTQTAEDKDGSPAEIVQHVTPETMGRVVEAFSKDVVVDVDHKSADGTDSRAAAWVTSVRVDPERGLVGTIEFTPYGADLVSGMEYRFVSVEWWVDDDSNPVELSAVAEGIIPEGEPVNVPKNLPGMNDGLEAKAPFKEDLNGIS